MCCWRRLRRLTAGLTKHKFHRDAFERRFRHHRQATACGTSTGAAVHLLAAKTSNILHTDDFEYVTQHSFVEMMTAATIVSHFEEEFLVRGEAHMKQDATCRKSLHGSVGISYEMNYYKT